MNSLIAVYCLSLQRSHVLDMNYRLRLKIQADFLMSHRFALLSIILHIWCGLVISRILRMEVSSDIYR